MSRKLLALGLAVACGSAFAQQRTEGPCGGYLTRYWVPQPVYVDGVYFGPIGGFPVAPGNVHDASPGGFTDVGDGKALLILAVVAAAALPVVLYAVDQDAGGDLVQCWAVPTEQFQFHGGAIGGRYGTTGYAGFRFGFGVGFLGLDANIEGGPSYRDVGGSIALRAVPKQHVDLALAFGARQVLDPAGGATWFELALPHRYSPFRADAYHPGVALEVRPSLLFGSGLDARLEAAVIVPFGPWANLRIGGQVYSMASTIRGGALMGFQFNL